jgi:hypothetical protein
MLSTGHFSGGDFVTMTRIRTVTVAAVLTLTPLAWPQTVGWDYYGKFDRHAISVNNGAESTSPTATLAIDFPGTQIPKGTLKLSVPAPPADAYMATYVNTNYMASKGFQFKSPIQVSASFDGSVWVNDSASVLRTIEVSIAISAAGQVCTGNTQTIQHAKGGSTVPVSVSANCSIPIYLSSIYYTIHLRTTPENDVHGSTGSAELGANSYYLFGLPQFRALPSLGSMKDKDSQTMKVQTGGIGPFPWQAKVTLQDGSPFPNITVTPASSAVQSGDTFPVAIASDPSGLKPGYYSAVITLTSPTPHIDPVKTSVLLTVTTASDGVSLGAESPPRTEKIYCGVPYDYSATAAYTLAQRDSAELRLYAKSGSTTAGMTSNTVQKGNGQQTLKVTGVSVPCGASGLTLYAALESSGTVLAKSGDIPYTLDTPLPDGIKIEPLLPNAGDTLVPGDTPTFFAMVTNTLGSVPAGEVYLELKDQNEKVLAWSTRHMNVQRGNGKALLFIDPIQVGVDVAKLYLRAVLADATSQGRELVKSSPVEYPVLAKPKIEITLGTVAGNMAGLTPSDGTWLGELPPSQRVLINLDTSLLGCGDPCASAASKTRSGSDRPAVMAVHDYQGPPATVELLVYFKTGNKVNMLKTLGPKEISSPNDRPLFELIYTRVPDTGDFLYLQARFTSASGQQILYDPLEVPMERIQIRGCSPVDDNAGELGGGACPGKPDILQPNPAQSFEIKLRAMGPICPTIRTSPNPGSLSFRSIPRPARLQPIPPRSISATIQPPPTSTASRRTTRWPSWGRSPRPASPSRFCRVPRPQRQPSPC